MWQLHSLYMFLFQFIVYCLIFITAAMTLFSFYHHSSLIDLFKKSLALCRTLILRRQESGNPSKGLSLKLLRRRFWERLTLGWVWFSTFALIWWVSKYIMKIFTSFQMQSWMYDWYCCTCAVVGPITCHAYHWYWSRSKLER